MLHARSGRQLVASAVLAIFATELRAWHGREPLCKVFWGYGVLASAILALFYVLAVHQERVLGQKMHFVRASYQAKPPSTPAANARSTWRRSIMWSISPV
jgi:hypothetical protein